jgi:hypothetical protein
MGSALEIMQADPRDAATIELFATITQPGWKPKEVAGKIQAIRSQREQPSWFQKFFFGAKDHLLPPSFISCTEGDIHKRFELLYEEVDIDGNSTIVGLDSSGWLLIFSIDKELGREILAAESTANGVLDVAMNEELTRARNLHGVGHPTSFSAPENGPMALPYA